MSLFKTTDQKNTYLPSVLVAMSGEVAEDKGHPEEDGPAVRVLLQEGHEQRGVFAIPLHGGLR